MKENKDNKGTIRYLEDGSEVALVCGVSDGMEDGYVVRNVYPDGFRGEMHVVGKVFPSPTYTVYDERILKLRKEIRALEIKKEQATAAYLASELEYGELLAKLKKKAVTSIFGGKDKPDGN